MESAITVKGQATIPKAIRQHLGLKPGDRVKFFVHPDGSVVLLPKLPASALRGIVKSRSRRPLTVEAMSDDAAQSAKATELIERRLTPENPGFVSVVAMAELVWVLERAYGLPDGEIAA